MGLPGPQPVLLFEPYPPPPAKLDQSSLGAADWFGFTQETSIQLPAKALLVPRSSPAPTISASAPANSRAVMVCLSWCSVHRRVHPFSGPFRWGFCGL